VQIRKDLDELEKHRLEGDRGGDDDPAVGLVMMMVMVVVWWCGGGYVVCLCGSVVDSFLSQSHLDARRYCSTTSRNCLLAIKSC